jgi:hypothetical protein
LLRELIFFVFSVPFVVHTVFVPFVVVFRTPA